MEKRTIFMNDRDRFRIIHDLFEFNNAENVPSPNVRFSLRRPSEINLYHLNQCFEVQLRNMEREPRKLLVEILAFCLMPNHYHLLIRQLVNGGIIKFMQKLGTGYTNYFNQKYERVGPLCQGRFKAILVERDEHLLYLPHYIHTNPLELVEPKWEEGEIKNWKRAMEFLESYRWSSYPDYIGKKNFPSVTSREFLTEMVGEPKEYKKATQEWLKDMDLENLEEVTLE